MIIRWRKPALRNFGCAQWCPTNQRLSEVTLQPKQWSHLTGLIDRINASLGKFVVNCAQALGHVYRSRPQSLWDAPHLSDHRHDVVELVNSRTNSLQPQWKRKISSLKTPSHVWTSRKQLYFKHEKIVCFELWYNFFWINMLYFSHEVQIQMHTTPAAPAVTAIGAVTELSPDAHITGMLTAREME